MLQLYRSVESNPMAGQYMYWRDTITSIVCETISLDEARDDIGMTSTKNFIYTQMHDHTRYKVLTWLVYRSYKSLHIMDITFFFLHVSGFFDNNGYKAKRGQRSSRNTTILEKNISTL